MVDIFKCQNCCLRYRHVISVLIFLSLTVLGVTSNVDSDRHLQQSVSEQTITDNWVKYVPEFNRMDDELYANAISNSAAEAFLRENAPSFSCPDAELERIYHFRWWTYRKHLRIADLGFGFRKTPQTVRRATLS